MTHMETFCRLQLEMQFWLNFGLSSFGKSSRIVIFLLPGFWFRILNLDLFVSIAGLLQVIPVLKI